MTGRMLLKGGAGKAFEAGTTLRLAETARNNPTNERRRSFNGGESLVNEFRHAITTPKKPMIVNRLTGLITPVACSGGHPACRRAGASCPAGPLRQAEQPLQTGSADPGGRMPALYGRQDARRYRQVVNASAWNWKAVHVLPCREKSGLLRPT